MMMIMMMMNCFCGMFDWWKALSLISSWDHCQRSSQAQISNMPWAGFEPVQNLSSGLVEWSCAVVVKEYKNNIFQNKNNIFQINLKMGEAWNDDYSIAIIQRKKRGQFSRVNLKFLKSLSLMMYIHFVITKLPPRSGSSLEAVEPHP